MKILILFLTFFTTALHAEERARDPDASGELKITWEPMEEETGNMHYLKRVTYELDGFKSLIIEANLATDTYPTGAREVHKLGPTRFLLIGGYSYGGGRHTRVAMILEGKDGRLLVQDQLEFSRARGFYEDRVLKLGETFAVVFPALPSENERVHHHELYDWYIQHKGVRHGYLSIIRRWHLTKIDESAGEMLAIRIGSDGFLLPITPQTEEADGGHPPADTGAE